MKSVSAAAAIVMVLSGVTACGASSADRPGASQRAEVTVDAPLDSVVRPGAAASLRTQTVAQPIASHSHRRHPWLRDDDKATPPAFEAPPCPPAAPRVHFSTAADAMRYLAWAWNVGYLNGLCQVTTPDARSALLQMHAEAVNLQFTRCEVNPDAAGHVCVFRHDYPARMHEHGRGGMALLAAPADNPGWYAQGFIGCG